MALRFLETGRVWLEAVSEELPLETLLILASKRPLTSAGNAWMALELKRRDESGSETGG